MSTIFCPKCGTKHEYQHVIPNFCIKCGNQLNAFAKAASPSFTLEEEEEETNFDPNAKIDVQIEGGNDPEDIHEAKGFALGSLFDPKYRAPARKRRNVVSLEEFKSR